MSIPQTQLVPLGELASGQAGAIRNEIIRSMVVTAMQQLRVSEDKIVVRDIRAKDDLDYTYEDWRETTGSTANAYETMSTGTMAADRWVGIFGVKLDGDDLSVTALKFNIAGADRAIWQLQALSAKDDFVGFSPSAVIIGPNAPYTISRFVRSVSATALVVLKGVVVERRGLVVSP